MGGETLTRELSAEPLTPLVDAERIKCEWGVAVAHRVEEGDWVEIPSVGGRASRKVERRRIAEFIEDRLGRLLERILHALQQSGYSDRLGGGVVITGGGANLRGLAELAASGSCIFPCGGACPHNPAQERRPRVGCRHRSVSVRSASR